jgi:hypothetical protein
MSTVNPLGSPSPGERRRWPRYAVERETPVILTADGRRFDARIEDISLGGIRLSLNTAPPRNIELRVEHAGIGSFYGTRSWRGDAAIGLAFDFSPRALDLLLHCLGPAVTADDLTLQPQA